MNTDIHIYPVTNRRALKRFIDFPYELYKNNPYWVPPLRRDQAFLLNPKKNPFYEHGDIQPFLAENARGEIVGRIAAIVNGMHLRKYNDANGFFGFFEVIEDYEIAHRLFDTAKEWLQQRNLQGMRGPTNPSMNDVSGLLVEGFDREPSILMPYNPPYYEDFLLRYGFKRAMTMWAYYLHKKYVNLERIERGVRLIHRRYPGLKLRKVDMSRFEEEARLIVDIYNDAWSENWGFVPMTDKEFEQLAKEFKPIVDPNIVFILEWNGEPVGMSVSLPNFNQVLKRIKDGRLTPGNLAQLLFRTQFCGINEARTALMGIKKKYQGRGFDVILNHATIIEGPKHGYDAAEMSWVLDVNKRLINELEHLNSVKDKQYALYELRFA